MSHRDELRRLCRIERTDGPCVRELKALLAPADLDADVVTLGGEGLTDGAISSPRPGITNDDIRRLADVYAWVCAAHSPDDYRSLSDFSDDELDEIRGFLAQDDKLAAQKAILAAMGGENQ